MTQNLGTPRRSPSRQVSIHLLLFCRLSGTSPTPPPKKPPRDYNREVECQDPAKEKHSLPYRVDVKLAGPASFPSGQAGDQLNTKTYLRAAA